MKGGPPGAPPGTTQNALAWALSAIFPQKRTETIFIKEHFSMGRLGKLPDGLCKRGGAYYADFYGGGRRIRKRLSTDLAAAKTILHDLKARADRANFNLLDNDYSLADLQEQFLKQCPAESQAKLSRALCGVPGSHSAAIVCQSSMPRADGERAALSARST
jgi:hypothetical protein